MNKIKSYFENLSFSEKSVPVALFVLCLLSFGLLIPKLGFYMDDWHYVFYANLKGVDSLAEMLTYDSRPGATWLYTFAFQVLGINRLAWHGLNFGLILVTAVTYWLLLREIWKEQRVNLTYVAMLFMIYPFLMIYSSPIGYTHLWVGFIAFNLSVFFMCLSTQESGAKKWLWFIVSIGLEVVHLFTSEYFAGLELIRVVIFWILISRSENLIFKKIFRVFVNWFPYLIVLGGFFYWRVVLYQYPEGITRNEPVIINILLDQPLVAVQFLANAFFSDFVAVLSVGWQQATDASKLSLLSPFVQFKILICSLGFVIFYFYFKKLIPNINQSKVEWVKSSFGLAIASLLTAGLPVWLVGRTIVESNNLVSASRFGIPSMFGAALFTFLVVDYFITDRVRKSIFLSFLIVLAINFHLDNTKEFQYSWEKQQRFMQQLIWRAPAIEYGTALLTDQEILGMMGEYAVSFSINNAYQVNDFGNNPPFWYFPFYYTNPNIDELLNGEPLEYKKLSIHFQGNSNHILLLDFNPEMKRCLWVLQPQDTNLRLVSEDVRKLAAGSNIHLIKQSNEEVFPPEEIYGKQNTQTWCYFFQKADLARQYQQWDEIIILWNESQEIGERPDNGFEYIPFIEGLGHAEDWGKVKELTKFANKITAGLEPSLCSALVRLAINAPESPERDETILNLKDDLSCTNY